MSGYREVSLTLGQTNAFFQIIIFIFLQKTQKTISAATPPHIKQPKKSLPSPKPSPPPKKEKSKKKEEKEEKQQKLETAAYLTETFHPIPFEPKGQSQEEFIPASILVERETTEEMTPM